MAREEARLLRSMAHVGKASSRPRSWSVKKEEQQYKDLAEQIQKSEENKPHNFVAPPPQQVHSFAASAHRAESPVHHFEPVSPIHNFGAPGAANPRPASPINQRAASPVSPGIETQAQSNNELLSERTPTPEQDIQISKEAEERQIKLEEERFNRYLGRTSHTRKDSSSAPVVPKKEAPPVAAAFKPIAIDKSSRQAVLLEISGNGSVKGEAGKITSFVITKKSVNIDAGTTDVSIIVKITAKNIDGNVVEIENIVHVEDDGHHVTYTPVYIGPHTVEIFVGGHLGTTLTVPVIEGGPHALNTDATYFSLKNTSVGNKAQLVVSPMSYIKRLVPLGYSALAAKVSHVESDTAIKNVSVLGNKEGHYVVSFYPAQPGDHIISVTLNGVHISGSPFVFNVVG